VLPDPAVETWEEAHYGHGPWSWPLNQDYFYHSTTWVALSQKDNTNGDMTGRDGWGHLLMSASETDAVARIAPARFTGSRNLNDLTTPQAIVPSDRVSKLYPRKLRLFQAATAVSDCRQRTGWMNPLRTNAPKGAFSVQGPRLRVVAPVCDVLYSPTGRPLQIPLI
jgi:hypothetical protein